eukprot:10670229-Ditylum_brightwellii.AAC.1
MMGCKKYITEALTCVQTLFGVLSKDDTLMVPGNDPEMGHSPTLSNVDHQKYQMLIGCIDIAFSAAFLVHFVACPHQGHTDRALYVFGYLKKRPNQRIRIDSHDLIVVKNGAEGLLDIDMVGKLKDKYPDVHESVDEKVPEPLFDELAITAYVNSNHAHDKLTRHFITGLIIFVGRTLIVFISKWQGVVETSTYWAEFMAMQTAVEEVMELRYMFWCLGVKVTKPTHIL